MYWIIYFRPAKREMQILVEYSLQQYPMYTTQAGTAQPPVNNKQEVAREEPQQPFNNK